MHLLLVTTLLAVGGGDAKDKAAGPKVDGKWIIVYAEEGGRRNVAWETRPAKIEDGTLEYEDDGKKRSMKLEFHGNQILKATGLGKEGKTDGKGVYIAGQDYLSISLITSNKREEGGSSGDFILILRKQRPK